MDKQNSYFDWINDLHAWLKDVEHNEMKHLIENLMQGEQKLKAFKHTSEKQLAIYQKNLLLDLSHYQQNKSQYNDLALQEFKETIWCELAVIADKSQLEWQSLLEDFKHNGEYHQGQWIGFGELVCKECGDITHSFHPTQISACNECGGIYFIRRALSP